MISIDMVAFNKKTHKAYSLGIRKEENQAKGIYRGTQRHAKTKTKAKAMPTVKVNKSTTRKTKRKTAVEKLQNEAKAFAGTMAETRISRIATLRAKKAEVEAKAKAQRVKQAEENAERAYELWMAKDAKRMTKAKAKADADRAAREWDAMDRRQQDAILEEHRTARREGRPIPANILNLSERFGKMSTGTVAHSTNSHAPWRGNTTKKYLKRVEEENEDFPYLSKSE